MAHRSIVDAQGRTWEIWEVTPRAVERPVKRVVVAPHLSHGWLAFESAREKRRLAPPPAGWEHFSDAELIECLNKAKPARLSRRMLG